MAEADADIEVLVRRWWQDVWGKGDLDAVDQLMAERYVRHDPNGTRAFTPAAYKAEMVQYLRAIHGATTTIDDVATSGDRVWARLTSRGVNLEAEQAVTVTWLAVYRFEAGRLAESWVLHRPGLEWT